MACVERNRPLMELAERHVRSRRIQEDSMENKEVNKWDRCDKCGELFPEDELIKVGLTALCEKCRIAIEEEPQ